MTRDDVINIFVLMTIGAILAKVIYEAEKTKNVSNWFDRFNAMWSWAMSNAYGMDPNNKGGQPIQQKNIQPSTGNPNVLGRGDLAS